MDMLTLLLLAVMPALVIVAGLRDLTTMIIPNWISGALIVGFFPAAFAAGLDLTTVGVHLGVALAAIALILLIHFRNLKNTLLALMPKVVGVIWMLGLMAYFHVQFNPANFMALPLILGIGLIFGVHVVHRLLDDPHEPIFSHSTGPAIALSAGTTIAGFGTLMIAKHQGIASLGFLMTAGVGANVVTSLVLLPAFVRMISSRKVAVADE